MKKRYQNIEKHRLVDRLSKGGRVFIPEWRIRQIKFEESIAHSIANRTENLEKFDIVIQHWTCCCGLMSCVCTASYRKVKKF